MKPSNSFRSALVSIYLSLVLVLTLASVGVSRIAPKIPPISILHNGVIWTVDNKNRSRKPWRSATASSLRSDRIATH